MSYELDSWGGSLPTSSSTTAFTTYRNYVEDLERIISLEYGPLDARHAAIVAAFQDMPLAAKLGKRNLSTGTLQEVRQSLERSWGMLRACWMPLEFDAYVTEFNASVPITVYYATYHAALAAIAATNHRGNSSHRTTLNELSTIVSKKLLPWPWSTQCTGPDVQDEFVFIGFRGDISAVSPLQGLSDGELTNRLGAMLKTTRKKELDRRFVERRKSLQKSNRKNLTRTEKTHIPASTVETTVFDVLYRIRKKANYEGSDDFVLGPSGSSDARRFGASLIHVADASVVALEALVDRAIGKDMVWKWLREYSARSGSAIALVRHIEALAPSRK